MLEHLGDHDGFVHKSCPPRRSDASAQRALQSDSVFRQTQAVFVGPRFTLQLLEEPLIVPDLQVLDATKHANVARR